MNLNFGAKNEKKMYFGAKNKKPKNQWLATLVSKIRKNGQSSFEIWFEIPPFHLNWEIVNTSSVNKIHFRIYDNSIDCSRLCLYNMVRPKVTEKIWRYVNNSAAFRQQLRFTQWEKRSFFATSFRSWITKFHS